jgi:glycosyltransferase involved in cell wall biosynthesis
VRVAIDYNAAVRQVAGIGRYTRELVRALLEAGTDDRFVLFYAARGMEGAFGYRDLRDLAATYPAVELAPMPLAERWLPIMWQRARLPAPVEWWTGRVDVLHAPDFVLPPSRTRRTLVTVHDLSFRLHPEAAHERLRRYLEAAVPRSLRRAAHVLADSRSTAADLERLMGVQPSKVTVLYPGVGRQFRRVEDRERQAEVRAKYGLPARFLFHIGTIEPRKNLVRLMDAYSRVRAEDAGAEPIGLVLAGKTGWLSEPIVERARQLEGVVLTGAVDDADLPVLHSLATALVYPSLYEGFGFPPLEALACGTPVVTSQTSSIPELVGDKAILIDPLDVDALAHALRQVLGDPAITARARTAGPAHAARFTWEHAAQQLLRIYRSLAAHPNALPASTKGEG